MKRFLALAILLSIAASIAPVSARTCPDLTDPAGDVVEGFEAYHNPLTAPATDPGDAVDMRSAAFSSSGSAVDIVLRVTDLQAPPRHTGGIAVYSVGFRSDRVGFEGWVERRGTTWTFHGMTGTYYITSSSVAVTGSVEIADDSMRLQVPGALGTGRILTDAYAYAFEYADYGAVNDAFRSTFRRPGFYREAYDEVSIRDQSRTVDLDASCA